MCTCDIALINCMLVMDMGKVFSDSIRIIIARSLLSVVIDIDRRTRIENVVI